MTFQTNLRHLSWFLCRFLNRSMTAWSLAIGRWSLLRFDGTSTGFSSPSVTPNSRATSASDCILCCGRKTVMVATASVPRLSDHNIYCIIELTPCSCVIFISKTTTSGLSFALFVQGALCPFCLLNVFEPCAVRKFQSQLSVLVQMLDGTRQGLGLTPFRGQFRGLS